MLPRNWISMSSILDFAISLRTTPVSHLAIQRPMMNIASVRNKLHGEVLVRMLDHDGSLIGPDAFISCRRMLLTDGCH